jgi:hypothetical protein
MSASSRREKRQPGRSGVTSCCWTPGGCDDDDVGRQRALELWYWTSHPGVATSAAKVVVEPAAAVTVRTARTAVKGRREEAGLARAGGGDGRRQSVRGVNRST